MIDVIDIATAFGLANTRRQKDGSFRVYSNHHICHRPVSGDNRSIEIDLYDDELDAYCYKCDKDVSTSVEKYIGKFA